MTSFLMRVAALTCVWLIAANANAATFGECINQCGTDPVFCSDEFTANASELGVAFAWLCEERAYYRTQAETLGMQCNQLAVQHDALQISLAKAYRVLSHKYRLGSRYRLESTVSSVNDGNYDALVTLLQSLAGDLVHARKNVAALKLQLARR